MKQLLLTIVLLPIVLLLPIKAGEPPVPPQVKVEWAKFQAALKADDLKILATMAKFPIRCNEFGGNIKSAKVFADRYKTIFPKATKQCLGKSGLQARRWDKRMHYEVSCDVGEYPIRFVFDFNDLKLLLTAIDNVNE
jgi:hypothetical protein